MKAYSPGLRSKIVAAVEAGRSKTEVARVFGIGLSTVKRYLKQHQETGSLEPKRHPGPALTIRPEQRVLLRAQLVGGAQSPLLGNAYLTLNGQRATEAADILEARWILPIHADGWKHYSENVESLREVFARAGLADRLLTLDRGAWTAL